MSRGNVQLAAKYGILPWVAVIIMIIANICGAGIPWVVVFVPILLLVVILAFSFLGLAFVALLLRKAASK